MPGRPVLPLSYARSPAVGDFITTRGQRGSSSKPELGPKSRHSGNTLGSTPWFSLSFPRKQNKTKPNPWDMNQNISSRFIDCPGDTGRVLGPETQTTGWRGPTLSSHAWEVTHTFPAGRMQRLGRQALMTPAPGGRNWSHKGVDREMSNYVGAGEMMK